VRAAGECRLNETISKGESSRVPDILVVDDSKVMRDMITACLRSDPSLAITHAASGLEAIERLSLKSYDVLVLDLNMPDIGGLEVIEFVRSQDKLKSLPILIVTTRSDDGSRERVLNAGASQYLTKPFTPEAILTEVRALLQATPATPATPATRATTGSSS
jgi:two-component system chemotaxis response regulator CheY